MAVVALEDAPRKARELFDKGFAALERGNLGYSIDMLLAALEIEPRLLQARKFLRAAEIKKYKEGKPGPHIISTLSNLPGLLKVMTSAKKKPVEALKAAEKLMRADPLNVTFINALVEAAVASDMPEAAIQTLEIAKEHYPENVILLQRLGHLYLQTNQTQEAKACFETFYKLRPNDPKALKVLKDASALDTMKKGGWNEAGSFRDVIKDSKGAALLEQESKAVKSSKDIDALINETRIKLQREPDNVNYRRALADLFARNEQFDEALEILTEAQAVSGRADPQIDRLIGSIRLRQFETLIAQLRAAGKTAEAEAKDKEKDAFLLEDASERVRRYPNDLQFRYEMAVLLFEHGRMNEAIQEFQLAQRNPARRTRALYYMAMCFKSKQQYDIALEQLEKASSEVNIMDDTKKDIIYEIGTIHELMGHQDKAVQNFKEIYSVDISYRDVAAKIEKAYKK